MVELAAPDVEGEHVHADHSELESLGQRRVVVAADVVGQRIELIADDEAVLQPVIVFGAAVFEDGCERAVAALAVGELDLRRVGVGAREVAEGVVDELRPAPRVRDRVDAAEEGIAEGEQGAHRFRLIRGALALVPVETDGEDAV